jgi:peroxiredoxin
MQEGDGAMKTRAPHTKSLLWLGVLLVSVLGVAGVPAALEIGEPAPDFTLPSTTGEQISLSQFRGKQPVLLEFYGADFSPACEANLSARKADYSKFQALNVQILGISANNPFSQKMLANSLQLPYPLLSDSTLSVIKAYGVLYGGPEGKNEYPHMVGRIAKRSFFLIDPQGIVRGHWIGGDLDVFPTERLLHMVVTMAKKP